MASSKPTPAIRIPKEVSLQTIQVDREKYPDRNLTIGEILAYMELMKKNPAEVYRTCLPELYNCWDICSKARIPLGMEEKGVNVEDAGEPEGYLESSGRGPLLYNTEADHIARQLAINEAIEEARRQKMRLDSRLDKERATTTREYQEKMKAIEMEAKEQEDKKREPQKQEGKRPPRQGR